MTEINDLRALIQVDPDSLEHAHYRITSVQNEVASIQDRLERLEYRRTMRPQVTLPEMTVWLVREMEKHPRTFGNDADYVASTADHVYRSNIDDFAESRRGFMHRDDWDAYVKMMVSSRAANRTANRLLLASVVLGVALVASLIAHAL